MGDPILLVFFLALTSMSLAAPAEDDSAAALGDLFGMMSAAAGGDAPAGQPNLEALFGTVEAAQQGGDAQDRQPNLGDLFGVMGGLMSAMEPKEDAEEIQQQMGQMSEMLGGLGLAPAGPHSTDVFLVSNAGGEGPTACALGFYDYENGCKPCDCHADGTELDENGVPFCVADSANGNFQCPCKRGFGGQFCDQCADAYFNFPSCEFCNCDFIASENLICDKQDGQCSCNLQFGGRTCSDCAHGYYNHPYCEEIDGNEASESDWGDEGSGSLALSSVQLSTNSIL